MLIEAIVAATVANLPPRPIDLVPDRAAYSTWLAGKVVEFDAQLSGTACPTASVRSLGGSPGGPAPFAAPAPDRIVSEGYYEFLVFEGCGRTRKPNLFTVRLQSGGWRAVGMLYGESNAELRLQFDVLPIAQTFLMQAASCQDGTTVRMGEVRLAKALNSIGVWEELWPATACGKSVAVKMTFTANPSGTTFSVQTIEREDG